jgi:tetratricopeptide (TPR) repeat protein
MARYSGDWPLQDLPRPALAKGWILKRYNGGVALASIEYKLPDSEVDGLEITWESPDEIDELGKGLARVASLDPAERSDIELGIGQSLGAQPGDIYAILEPVKRVDDAHSLQLARRLLGICLVDTVAEDSSTCRLWRGSALVPSKRPIAVGDSALFLEHTYGRAPRQALIQIASIEGDDGNLVRDTLRDAFSGYLKSFPMPNATVDTVEESFDATSMDFHRNDTALEYEGHPQVVVGGSIVERDGVEHLVINYTGIGPAVGPGMVAAPPEGGVDLGPVDSLDANDVRALAGVVWAAVLVYRGQTSEALVHLHLVLSDRSVTGPFRWHARDQYAMRWAALGFVDQALWLVLEDERVAAQANNERAYLNAMGTRVRLYDLLELPAQAARASKQYLERREQFGEKDSGWVSAVGMHAEMLLADGRVDEAQAVLKGLRENCPKGCEGDLGVMLAGAYWAAPEEESELRAALLEDIVHLAQEGSTERMASARTYQGLAALRDDRLEDALIAFLEAERLYGESNNLPGVARTKYFMFLAELGRQEPQKAFELAIESIERDRELGDFASAARTYERLAALYTNFNPQTKPGPWLGAARDVLTATVQAQLARGAYGKTSEGLFGLGAFLLRLGNLDSARNTLQRGVLFAIRSTRFDIAAMCHLWLGLIAREANDPETFRDEIHRAQVMAEISDDPSVMEAIQRALEPSDQPDDPTQLL